MEDYAQQEDIQKQKEHEAMRKQCEEQYNRIKKALEEAPEPDPPVLGTEKDPWKHRAMGMRCSTCMWFVHKEASGGYTPVRSSIGRCRRHAPSMNGYPVVKMHDWCGDHKIDENKL